MGMMAQITNGMRRELAWQKLLLDPGDPSPLYTVPYKQIWKSTDSYNFFLILKFGIQIVHRLHRRWKMQTHFNVEHSTRFQCFFNWPVERSPINTVSNGFQSFLTDPLTIQLDFNDFSKWILRFLERNFDPTNDLTKKWKFKKNHQFLQKNQSPINYKNVVGLGCRRLYMLAYIEK